MDERGGEAGWIRSLNHGRLSGAGRPSPMKNFPESGQSLIHWTVRLSPSLAPPKSCHKTELLIANFNYNPQIYFTQHGGPEKIEIDSLFSKEGFPDGSAIKNLPAMQETQVRSLGQEDSLEEEMATHSRILAWKIPWTEKRGGLESTGSQKE